MSDEYAHLGALIEPIRDFLQTNLQLAIHEDKQFLKTVASGIDFLGWVHFPDHRVSRTTTKHRMFRTLQAQLDNAATRASYRGVLAQGNAYQLQKNVIQQVAGSYHTLLLN